MLRHMNSKSLYAPYSKEIYGFVGFVGSQLHLMSRSVEGLQNPLLGTAPKLNRDLCRDVESIMTDLVQRGSEGRNAVFKKRLLWGKTSTTP